MANEAFKRKSYKLVPPDGGYGYVVVAALSLNLMTGTMFYVCFGVIYKDFFIKLGMGTTSISLVTGIRALGIALSGFLTGPLLKVLSRRKLAFIGCMFFNSGVLATVFVETQAQFIVCQGFMQTFGLGFLYNVACTLINDYFIENRLLTSSIMNTLAAMLWVRDYFATLALLAVMGISRCTIMVLLPLVVADCVQPEEYPSAIGISFGFYGLICIILGPIIGVIRDRTGSYMIMFIIIIVIFSVVTVAWSIEILLDYRRGKIEKPVAMKREIRSMSIGI